MTESLASLEGEAVVIDTLVINGFTAQDEGLHKGDAPGILRIMHPSEFDDFWWTLLDDLYVDVPPACSFIIRRDRFQGTGWDGRALVIDTDCLQRRVVPLV